VSIGTRDGALDVDGRAVPLVAGEVQFWRMDPARWGPALDAAVDAGVTMISTYLSWRRHQPEADGPVDFGGRLDAARFARLCAERGLLLQVKPGPWICAEEPGGGYPDWLLARTDLMALDAAGDPVIGYNPPFLHRVPSIHTPGYLDAARAWFGHVWAQLGGLVHPHGPIVAVQLDNEPGYAFQDALYVADYHPAAVAAFRRWLVGRYGGDSAAWRRAWGAVEPDEPATAEPPRPPAAPGDGPVGAAVRDWVAFTGEAVVAHLDALRRMHDELGAGALLPTVNLINHPVHDLPVAHTAVRDGLGGLAAVGVDHYYVPPVGWGDVNRLGLTAATARAAGEPCVWAPELMSGIWRSPGELVTYPDPTPDEQAAWWGAALALGYQGLNLYMLADRENWEFAPVTRDGVTTPLGAHVRALARLLADRPEVRRSAPVANVTLVWDDEDALAAYAATGTARHPGVLWARPDEGLAYRETVRIGAELLAAGFVYDVWQPRRGGRPPEGAMLVVAGASTWSGGGNPAGALVVPTGRPVRPLLPATPPARIDRAGDPDDPGGLAVPHTGPGGDLLHVARWRVGPAELVLAAERAAGTWRPLLGPAAPLERVGPARWRLPAAVPHLVLQWVPDVAA